MERASEQHLLDAAEASLQQFVDNCGARRLGVQVRRRSHSVTLTIPKPTDQHLAALTRQASVEQAAHRILPLLADRPLRRRDIPRAAGIRRQTALAAVRWLLSKKLAREHPRTRRIHAVRPDCADALNQEKE